MNRGTSTRAKQRKYVRRRIFALVFMLLLVGGIGYAANLAFKASSAVGNAAMDLGKSGLRDEDVSPVTHNVSVLIMGVDESEKRSKEYGEAVRTDALLLATFNKDDKSVKLVSIPRDTYTYIPVENKKDKITHAHATGAVKYGGEEGGPKATREAVEGLFNIPVDYFVKFNFESFIKIVDALGGIEVDVPVEFTEQDSNDVPDAIHVKKGLQTLNGEQALALARTRHIDSDIMRGQRQQLVIEAIVKKLASVGSVTKVGTIIDSIDGQFKTNLTFNNMLSFYKYGIGATIEKLQVVGEDKYIGGVYYYVPEKQKLSELTRQLRMHLGMSPTFVPKYKQNEQR
ncbi:LCP family protein required for cell wall assembly [Priestia taiwanensis]|uniref:LytR family transcriptional regulator n=1 Tax=Priestia taiwanensis TaxID=1347902 RepID=A0A917AQI5_9BACI|nr:LCP family protein required for cell wall assembly [Priestia taiwanensis]GGE67324.1 LytR family transcriptional regulator [Priestia taiwanensis]